MSNKLGVFSLPTRALVNPMPLAPKTMSSSYRGRVMITLSKMRQDRQEQLVDQFQHYFMDIRMTLPHIWPLEMLAVVDRRLRRLRRIPICPSKLQPTFCLGQYL